MELGGFPLCDPVYEDDAVIASVQNSVTSHQRQLVTANFYNYRQGVLHLLASKPRLDENEKALLASFLDKDSMQRVNLFQKDYLGREPLAVAIESKNIDFIEAVACSTASLDRAWFKFFNIDSPEFLQTLVTQFTPPKQTELAKLRQQSSDQEVGLSRFKYLTAILQHFKANLQMRIQAG